MEEFSAGNFNNGQHAVTVRAIDSAGNEVIKQVVFIVDYFNNDLMERQIVNMSSQLNLHQNQ